MEFLGKTVAGVMISDGAITLIFTDETSALITAVLQVTEKPAASPALDATKISLALHLDNEGTP
jgi:hypothetical protein